MNVLSVSTHSIREQFGPVTFDFVDPQGNDVHIDLPYPKLLRLSEFPVRARDAFGVDSIETVAFQFAGLEDPEISLFAAALASSGVRLLNVAIHFGDLLEVDNDKRAADITVIEQWIDRFAAMGSQFVRVSPGSASRPHRGEKPPAHLIDALTEIGLFANERGTRLLVENDGGASSDPTWMRYLLDEVGRDACGLLLDLGNFDVLTSRVMPILLSGATGQPADQVDLSDVLAGIDLTALYDGIDALADHAELVSLKAHHVSDDGAVGFVDLERALGILIAHGYVGPLSVEYDGNGGDPWAKCARILELATAVLGSSRTTMTGGQ